MCFVVLCVRDYICGDVCVLWCCVFVIIFVVMFVFVSLRCARLRLVLCFILYYYVTSMCLHLQCCHEAYVMFWCCESTCGCSVRAVVTAYLVVT